RLAVGVARHLSRTDLDRVWACGLLAPLGWLAACALDADAVAACLADPTLHSDAGLTQRRHWGLDAASVGRRLARRWGLPSWLAACATLPFPLAVVRPLGVDADLFALARLAAGLARADGFDLGLVGREAVRECTAALGLPSDFRPDGLEEIDPPPAWQD